jgi:hypothetical protein
MVIEKAACLGERVKEMALERMIIVATLKGLSASKNCRNSWRKQDIINLGVLIKLVTSPCVEREHMG